jgi:hypothetical protein
MSFSLPKLMTAATAILLGTYFWLRRRSLAPPRVTRHEQPPLGNHRAQLSIARPTDLPASVLVQRICPVDLTLVSELASVVRTALGDVSDLSKLHELPEGQAEMSKSKFGRTNVFSRRWRQGIDRHANPELRKKLDVLVRRFVVECFSPAADAKVHGWDHFIYQYEPSLRIHMPFTRSLGIPHRDYDYYHQPNELNAWIPLVPHVFGSNSLYCESVPGRQDFEPFELRFGSFVRFWGNQCVHFTKLNETDVTRVSLDIRVVPVPSATSGAAALFDPEWKNQKSGTVAFRLGEYYRSTAEPLDGHYDGPGVVCE